MRITIDPADIVVEIFSVTLAILLALGIGAWQTRVHDRQRLNGSVGNIVAELRSNRAMLERERPRHARILAELYAGERRAGSTQYVSERAYHAALSAGAPHGSGLAIPRSTAWQIAQTGQTLDLMPYAIRARLTGLYDLQAFYFTDEQQFVEQMLSVSAPPNGNYYWTTSVLQARLQDLVNLEDELQRQYRSTAGDLRKRYPDARSS
ncbi:MAG TPA: hypothetical protein VJP76_06640 [Candidatus Tumulicola sp.]|nr:hypothetical protein [Candidatus Tumulicola sp.]